MTYDWPQLPESTQAEREQAGYAPNDPLLRSGELRDSIKHHVISAEEAEIGTDDDAGLYAELGTVTEPPRPFLAGAAAHKGKECAEIVGEYVAAVMLGRRVVAHVIPIK